MKKASLQGRREKGEGRRQKTKQFLPSAFSLQAAFFSGLLGGQGGAGAWRDEVL
jgi:hypothetical protein